MALFIMHCAANMQIYITLKKENPGPSAFWVLTYQLST